MFSAQKKRSKMLFLLACILVFVPVPCVAAEQLSAISFSAKKTDVMLTSIQKPVKAKGEYVEVTLQGRLYKPGIDLPLKVKDTTDRSTPENALSLDHHANLSDNAALIVAGWMPEDRPEIQKMLADSKVRSLNKKAVAQIHKMTLKGIVEYKGYALALISHNNGDGPIHPVITMKKVGNEWFLTNALSGDDVVNILMSVHNGYGQIKIAK